MEQAEKEALKQLDCVAFRKLWPYFTGEDLNLFDNGYIGFHPAGSDEIVDEIINTTDRLAPYIEKYWSDVAIDYHYHSERGCYFLSSIFCLANPSWEVVQGEFDFSNKEKHYFHSWLKKGTIVYDPAMRVVTLESLHQEFFIPKYHYTKEELIALFKRTGVFTYYEEDLKEGCVNPLGQLYYDTEEAEQMATQKIEQLESFLNGKIK